MVSQLETVSQIPTYIDSGKTILVVRYVSVLECKTICYRVKYGQTCLDTDDLAD